MIDIKHRTILVFITLLDILPQLIIFLVLQPCMFDAFYLTGHIPVVVHWFFHSHKQLTCDIASLGTATLKFTTPCLRDGALTEAIAIMPVSGEECETRSATHSRVQWLFHVDDHPYRFARGSGFQMRWDADMELKVKYGMKNRNIDYVGSRISCENYRFESFIQVDPIGMRRTMAFNRGSNKSWICAGMIVVIKINTCFIRYNDLIF